MDHPVLSKRKVKGQYQIIFLQRTIPLCNLIISPSEQSTCSGGHIKRCMHTCIHVFGWRVVKMAHSEHSEHSAFPMSTKPFI